MIASGQGLAAAGPSAVRSKAMKRDAAKTIFRTVMLAGALLGAGACGKKQAPAAPPAPEAAPAEAPTPTEEGAPAEDKAAEDPDQGGE